MIDTLKLLKKQYGDIAISELIKELEKPKEIVIRYWLWFSHFGNGRPYITSDKKDWDMIKCENIKEAETRIEEIIKEDAKNNIKSIYNKKEGD